MWRYVLHELWLVLRLRWLRWLLCTAVVVSVLGSYLTWAVMASASRALQTHCSDAENIAFLDEMCSDHLNGLITGSLCEALCVKKEVEYVKCVGHRLNGRVLLAQWHTHTITLKTSVPVTKLHSMRPNFFKGHITKKEFIKNANMSVFLNLAGRRSVPLTGSVLETIFSECDLLEDGLLAHTEALVCWQLLETNEYMLYSLLAGNTAIPDVYGVCGNMYAVQYASSEPYMDEKPYFYDHRSWSIRVRLALAVLELALFLEYTPYGTLYLCDVKESNFGVVKREGSGELMAKAIDLDHAWFEGSPVQAKEGVACERDEDCSFLSCQLPCRPDTHTCSGAITSNNLQVVCERLFLPHYWWGPALLRDPPPSLVPQLQPLLKECLSPTLPQPHLNIQLLHQLAILLWDSISTT